MKVFNGLDNRIRPVIGSLVSERQARKAGTYSPGLDDGACLTLRLSLHIVYAWAVSPTRVELRADGFLPDKSRNSILPSGQHS